MNQKTRNIIIHIICSLAVMAAAVIVRLPSVYLTGTNDAEYESYTREDGLPYLQEMDSYYHVRLVDNYLNNGTLGDKVLEDGTAWDSLRYYPDGMSAEYQPGIIWITVTLWKILNSMFGTDIYTVEYYLSAVMAALTALIAYIAGFRLSGKAGGFVSGVLVSCTSGFVMRSSIGRYDTDMIVILMDILLVLTMTEVLRAKKLRNRIIFSFLFGLSAWLYTICWTTDGAVLYIGLVLLGGLLYIITMFFSDRYKKKNEEKIRLEEKAREEEKKERALRSQHSKKQKKSADKKTNETASKSDDSSDNSLNVVTNKNVEKNKSEEILEEKNTRYNIHEILSKDSAAWILAAFSSFILIIITYGPSIIISTFGAFVSSIDLTNSGILPNIYSSVVELQKPIFAPDSFSQLFSGYVEGSEVYIVNGVGGAMIFLLSIISLVWLSMHCFKHFRKDNELILSSRECAMYAIVMGVMFFGGLYATERGSRFVEHLAVPVGILGGAFIGWVSVGMQKEKVKIEIFKIVFSVFLSIVSVIPVIKGSIDYCKESRPSVSDATQEAMKWIKENSDNEDSIIASWWDMGYFYESESGHPCFWDGGSSTGIRAILISKALTSDPELSKKILLMIANSGDRPIEILMEHAETKKAFETLWNALVLDKDEAVKELEKCGLSKTESAELEQMLHPQEKKEIYLVMSRTMLYQIGWYEHFANWDFTGEQGNPQATTYRYTPDGYSINDSEEGKKYQKEVRSKETIWRLLVEGEQPDGYVCTFGKDDGVEQVIVWKIY